MTADPVVAHLLFAAAWASFGAVHSLLATDAVKANARPQFKPYYRLFYNILAGIHFLGILALELLVLPRHLVFDWSPGVAWTLGAVQALGWIVLIVALTRYDLGRFSGFAEATDALAIAEERRRKGVRDKPVFGRALPEPGVEPLRTNHIHAYVRHPLYTGMFLILWGRIANEYQLATAIWGSLYLVVGTWFEERKLLRLYGKVYADYRARVPAYFPWRGKAY